jgi:uncharacterized protein YidB (DUF937 family)
VDDRALDYAVSAVLIGALMVFLAYSPDAANRWGQTWVPARHQFNLVGQTVQLALVAAAITAAAMTAGLDRRIALFVLSKVMPKPTIL